LRSQILGMLTPRQVRWHASLCIHVEPCRDALLPPGGEVWANLNALNVVIPPLCVWRVPLWPPR
jgi:hypothetical protein